MNPIFKLKGNVADLEVYEDHVVCIGKTTFKAALMGRAYIEFFKKNPSYFDFIYNNNFYI